MMTDDNGTSTDDVIVKVESDTEGEAKTDTQGIEGETSTQNEPSKPQSQDEKRSAGKVIAELGNEKKAFASKLVSLAKSSESSRQEVRRMLIEDPATGSYLKSKFGDDYDAIIGDKPIAKESGVDIEKIKEQARAQAEAEAIKLQLQQNNDDMLRHKAEQLKFTSDEFELLKAKARLLADGGDEDPINNAALIVNFKKSTAKKGEFASEGEAPMPKKREVTITPALSDFSDSQHLDKKSFASDIQRVKSLHRTDNQGKSIMDLPSL